MNPKEKDYILRAVLESTENNLVAKIEFLKGQIKERLQLKEEFLEGLESVDNVLEDILDSQKYRIEKNQSLETNLKGEKAKLPEKKAMQEIEAWKDIQDLEEKLKEAEEELMEQQAFKFKDDKGR